MADFLFQPLQSSRLHARNMVKLVERDFVGAWHPLVYSAIEFPVSEHVVGGVCEKGRQRWLS